MSSNRRLHKVWLSAALVFLALSLSTQATADQEIGIAPLPESLGQWYKPANKRQVWLHTMFSLRRELQAIEEYTAEEDLPLLKKWSGKFLAHFRKLTEMVPEWQDEIELAEALQLEEAVAAGEFQAIPNILNRLQRNCRSCHREYRALAALKYRTANFSGLKIESGEGEGLSYADHMDALSTSINRIKIASEDGLWEKAAAASNRLRTKLDQLGPSCYACHKDEAPKERILGVASRQILDALDAALQSQQGDETGMKLGEAAVAICARCHGIHRTPNDVRQHLFQSR